VFVASCQVISSSFLNGSDVKRVAQFGISQPEGLAVDWIAHSLYWTDFGRGRVEMSRLDGRSRLVLVWQDVRPRAIAVDPMNGSVFPCFAVARSCSEYLYEAMPPKHVDWKRTKAHKYALLAVLTFVKCFINYNDAVVL